MAELHESLIVIFRKKNLKRGFRESKTPMPTYRPDVFVQKISKTGKIIEEILAEAEIKSTLFIEHTSNQLVLMEKYMRLKLREKIKVSGYLIIPVDGIKPAKSLLNTLFPDKCLIKIYPVNIRH